jgi:hypothetical protein
MVNLNFKFEIPNQDDQSEKVPTGEEGDTMMLKDFHEESLFHSGFIRERFINSHTPQHFANVFIFTGND